MSAGTVKLIGNLARHPRGVQFCFDGRNYRAVVGPPPDQIITIQPFGEDIPVDIAEFLFRIDGTFVRFPGGDYNQDPVAPIPEQVARQEAQAQADATRDAVALTGASQADIRWPGADTGLDELQGIALLLGLTVADLEDASRADLLDFCRAGIEERYPAVAEAGKAVERGQQ